MNNKTFAHRLRQAGFTLVEILVALIIGMLVVLAAMASMLGTRSTAMTGDDVNALHQSSALAFRLLGQQIRQAGYFPIDATGPLYYFDVNANPKLESEPAFFAIKGQEAAAGSVNDTLNVGFAAESGLLPRLPWPGGQELGGRSVHPRQSRGPRERALDHQRVLRGQRRLAVQGQRSYHAAADH